jgi:hypothetical protein
VRSVAHCGAARSSHGHQLVNMCLAAARNRISSGTKSSRATSSLKVPTSKREMHEYKINLSGEAQGARGVKRVGGYGELARADGAGSWCIRCISLTRSVKYARRENVRWARRSPVACVRAGRELGMPGGCRNGTAVKCGEGSAWKYKLRQSNAVPYCIKRKILLQIGENSLRGQWESSNLFI